MHLVKNLLTLSLTQFIISYLMRQYHQINHALQKVLNSQCFSKSVVLKELFKHLVEKSVKGEDLNEVDIAYEVFGKKHDQDKEVNIRIYVFNLRKKLHEYYEKEGQNDEIVFSIPKGNYEVDITVNRKLIWKSRMVKFSPVLLVFSVLFMALTFIVNHSEKRPEITRSFLWNGIYKSDYPLLIVLGDHYFVLARNKMGQLGTTRYTHINSDNDFNSLLSELPETQNDFLKTDQTYINKQAPFAMYKVLSFLGGNQVDIDMRYSSDLQWEHLAKNNTLFIGSYKTQGILKDIFEKTGIYFNIDESEVSYTHNDSTEVFQSRQSEFLSKEFASLIHFTTNDSRIVMALMCNTDLGNIALVKHISEPENLEKLKEYALNFPNDNFRAIFEVSGQKQTDFKIQLKYIDPITIDIDEIWP